MKAIVFPGQGSQVKGMGETLFDEYPDLTKIADDILGYSIKALCLQDPNKELNKTQFTQVAIYVVNALSYYKYIDEGGEQPDFFAGHSLGEFNALLAAGSFSFETGLRLVKKRGELMSQAAGGGMAAILNIEKEKIEQMLSDNKLDKIEVANHNTLTQSVISGDAKQLAQAQTLFETGSAMYVPLNTSGAFHSRFMVDAQQAFTNYVADFQLSVPKIPIVANVSARQYQQDNVVTNITTQISSAVKWFDSVKYMIDQGVTDFIELGHNPVLTNIIGKIKRELGVENKPAPAKPHVTPLQNVAIEKRADVAKAARDKVAQWNSSHAVGAVVKSTLASYDELTTRTPAVVLFGHRAVVYMQGYNGYFSLDELMAS